MTCDIGGHLTNEMPETQHLTAKNESWNVERGMTLNVNANIQQPNNDKFLKTMSDFSNLGTQLWKKLKICF